MDLPTKITPKRFLVGKINTTLFKKLGRYVSR